MEEIGSVCGFALKMGADAYGDKTRFPSGPWCERGDWVLMRSYGTRFKVHGKEFRLINDDSVEAVVEDPGDSEGMSEEQMEEQTMSSGDKFFGVKTTFDDKGEPVEDVDVEVVDDRPPEDRRPPAKKQKRRNPVTRKNWRVTPRRLKNASISSAINSMRSVGNAKPLKRCAKKLSEWRKVCG